MQPSPDLRGTPLPPPFPADATPVTAGTSGCLGGGHSWEAQNGTLWGGWVGEMLQGAGEGMILSLCCPLSPGPGNLHIPLGNVHGQGEPVSPGAFPLLPAP